MADQGLEKKLTDLTRFNGYPHYPAFKQLDRFFKYLYREVRLPKGLSQDEKRELYFKPNPYRQDKATRDVDGDLFKLLSSAAELLYATKRLYHENNLRFDESHFANDDMLLEAVVSEEYFQDNAAFDTACANIPLRFLESIEDKWYLFSDFESFRNNPRMLTFMKQHLSGFDNFHNNPRMRTFMTKHVAGIAKFAELGKRIIPVMEGYGLQSEAGRLESLMRQLKDQKQIYHDLQHNHLDKVHEQILGLHAQLKGVACIRGKSTEFTSTMGLENTLIMEIAKAYHFAFNAAIELYEMKPEERGQRRKKMIDEGGDLAIRSEDEDAKENWPRDFMYAIYLQMSKDDLDPILEKIRFTRMFLDDLDTKLSALYVPLQMAKVIEENLADDLVSVEETNKRTKRPTTADERIYRQMYRGGKRFHQSIKDVIHKTLGAEPAPGRYSSIERSNVNLSRSIGSIIYAGASEKARAYMIRETWSKFPEHEAIKMLLQQYDPEQVNLYVRQNRGVCSTFDINNLDLINPATTIIEVADDHLDIKPYDPLASRIQMLQTYLHETIHAAQIDKRILWRYIAVESSWTACEQALQFMKWGVFRTEVEGTRVKDLRFKGHTYKDEVLDDLLADKMQCLGTGALAKTMRTEGTHAGYLQNGYESGEDGLINPALLQKMKYETSKTADLMDEVIFAIKREDQEKLTRLYHKSRRLYEDMLSLIETAAEAFSLDIMQTFIKRIPDRKISKEQREAYATSLYRGLVRRGGQGKRFLNIMRRTENKSERARLLAQAGMQYLPIIGKDSHDAPIEKNLFQLGYDPLDPREAYSNTSKLFSKAREQGIGPEGVLEPMNYPKAIFDVRYCSHIPVMTKIIQKQGPKKAYKAICEVETIKELYTLAKS